MEHGAKIYIAGHTGLVGAAIVRALQRKDYSNLVMKPLDELDCTDQHQVESFFAAEKPDYVFLAAAKVGGILANSTYPADFIYDNLAIAVNVIRSSWRHGVKKLLNLGSSCIYPRLAPQPLREESILTGPLEATNEPYAVAKIAAIKLCRYFNEQYGTDFISVMPTNLYGPGDNFNLETAHVLPSLIRKFALASLVGKSDYRGIRRDVARFPLGFGLPPFNAQTTDQEIRTALEKLGIGASEVTLWGTGSPFREFLHVDDCADAIIYLMEGFHYNQIGEILNIGTGSDQRISELATMVKDVVGFHGTIRFDSSKPDGTPRKQLDISRLRALGWRPNIRLSDGVRRVFEWYSGESRGE